MPVAGEIDADGPVAVTAAPSLSMTGAPTAVASARSDLRMAIVATTAVLVAGQATIFLGRVEVVEVAQMLVFGYLLVAAYVWRDRPWRDLLVALMLLPILQLLSLVLPTRLLPMTQWFVLIGVPVYLMLAIVAYHLGLRPADIGIRRTRWQPQLRAVLLGAVLSVPAYVILEPAPLVADPTPVNLITAVAIVAIFGGLLEEGLLRGVIQRVADRLMARGSILVSAFATGLLYASSLNLRYLVFAVLVGIAFSFIVRRTDSIVGAALGHAALFAGQLVLLPALLG